ncbi:MAG: hypothetical protein ABWY49_04500 [Rhizobium sp.]
MRQVAGQALIAFGNFNVAAEVCDAADLGCTIQHRVAQVLLLPRCATSPHRRGNAK